MIRKSLCAEQQRNHAGPPAEQHWHCGSGAFFYLVGKAERTYRTNNAGNCHNNAGDQLQIHIHNAAHNMFSEDGHDCNCEKQLRVMS